MKMTSSPGVVRMSTTDRRDTRHSCACCRGIDASCGSLGLTLRKFGSSSPIYGPHPRCHVLPPSSFQASCSCFKTSAFA